MRQFCGFDVPVILLQERQGLFSPGNLFGNSGGEGNLVAPVNERPGMWVCRRNYCAGMVGTEGGTVGVLGVELFEEEPPRAARAMPPTAAPAAPKMM